MNDSTQFDRIHEMGAEEFGALWLDANKWAVNVARALGEDYVEHKILISRIVLATLRRAKIFDSGDEA